jgi:hypothetical protein
VIKVVLLFLIVFAVVVVVGGLSYKLFEFYKNRPARLAKKIDKLERKLDIK